MTNRLTELGRAILASGGPEAVALRFNMRSDSTNPRVLAKVAADMILHYDRYDDLGRSFDNCFEQGCGDKVIALLCQRAATDPALREKMAGFGMSVWLDRYAEQRLALQPSSNGQG